MKKLIFILFLFTTGCWHRDIEIDVQSAAEDYLDTLYRNNKVEDKWGIGFIKSTDYLNPLNKDYADRSKLEIFKGIIERRKSTAEWIIFTEKANDILSKVKERNKGYIHLETYKVNQTNDTRAFFVDSALKVYATVKL
jgi:hypothetical protein